MISIEDFIYNQTGETREVLLYLDELLMGYGLINKIRYRVPFYYQKSWICYLNPLKKTGVEMAFIRGNELSNTQGLLDFNNRKQVAGISIVSLKDIPEQALRELITEALTLDEFVLYASKRSKKK